MKTPAGRWELLNTSTNIGGGVASRDAEPEQLDDARRTRVDVQHTTLTQGARLRVQDGRACQRRLKDDAPGDVELEYKVVGAWG